MENSVIRVWKVFLFISQCSLAYAGTVDLVDISPKQMGMGGAGSAQVNDATSMAINPAGMAIRDSSESDTVDFVLSYAESSVHRDEISYEKADALSIFWAKRYYKWTVGVGLYDTASLNLDYLEMDGDQLLTQSTHLGGYDISLYLAYDYSEDFKLGATFKMSSVITDYKDASNSKLEDEVWSLRLGAKYFVFDTPIDFSNSSMQLAWQLAAAYEPESEFQPFAELKTHPLKNREVSGFPELCLVGSTIRFGWIFDSFSFVIHLNTDLSQETYNQMSDLLIVSERVDNKRGDVVLTKKMLGSEWLFKGTDPNSITYALRFGLSDQSSNFENELEEQKASFGLGFIGKNASFELAVQKQLSETEEEQTKNEDLIWSIGMGVAF